MSPNLNLNGRLAQLCVLYEDLRIEMLGIRAKSIGEMDDIDSMYRQHYFLRRSIGTLREFSYGLVNLDEFPAFVTILNGFNEGDQSIWRKSVEFFKKHKNQVDAVRNNVGGHFGLEAALYAIKSLRPDAVGTIEVNDVTMRGTVITECRLRFAGEIAATATLRSLPGSTDDESLEKEYIRLVKVVGDGYEHATLATTVVVVNRMWDRFV